MGVPGERTTEESYATLSWNQLPAKFKAERRFRGRCIGSQLKIPISNETNVTLKLSSTEIQASVIGIQPEPDEKIQYVTTKELGKRLRLLKEITKLLQISANDREARSKLVQSYHDIFTLEGDPIPCMHLEKHQIIVEDERPINNAFYCHPECHKIEIHQQVTDMLNKRVMSISKLPFSSP